MSRTRSRLRLLLPAAVAAAAVAAALLYLGPGSGGEAGWVELPERLPDGGVVQHVFTGERALGMTAGLHWRPGEVAGLIRRAVVAVYTDGVMLWVADLGSGEQACRAVERMASRIAENADRLPYTPPVAHEVAGVKVYFTFHRETGVNAFWCRGPLVVWAELGSPARAAQLLEALVEGVEPR